MKSSTPSDHNGMPSARLAALRGFWLDTAARYTVLVLLSLGVNALMSRSLTGTYMDTLRFLLLLPFAAALTGGARIRHASLSGGAKLALHALCVLGGFYLSVYLPYQLTVRPTGQQILLLLMLVLVIYVITVVIYIVARGSARQKRVDETPYVSQFGSRK